jgi:hypothetical protein
VVVGGGWWVVGGGWWVVEVVGGGWEGMGEKKKKKIKLNLKNYVCSFPPFPRRAGL